MENIIHKRGSEGSTTVDKARKLARIDSGDIFIHPFQKIRVNKTLFTRQIQCSIAYPTYRTLGVKIAKINGEVQNIPV